MPTLLVFAAVLGASGVVLGAFGAHALSERLDAAQLASWQTAVQYHLIHAVAVLAISLFVAARTADGLATWLTWSGWLMAVGVVLFSGSIYLLVLGGPRWLGPVTPLGGLAMIAGWIAVVVGSLRA